VAKAVGMQVELSLQLWMVNDVLKPQLQHFKK
jgi:hypothetical protein